jgi:ubiquinone/menaquinone biosynthesis C-methylase UbiE
MNKQVYKQFFENERDHWWFAGMRTICKSLLASVPRAIRQERCLDVGCGTGLWTQELNEYGFACGIDVAAEALHFCRERGLSRLVHCEGEGLPFAENSWDIITALGVIEHIEDDKAFLNELYRVCAPGGYVLLLTSAYKLLWSRHDDIVHHKRRYLRSEFEHLLKQAHFTVVRSSHVNSILFPPILAVRLAQRFLGRRTVSERDVSPELFKPAAAINRLLYFVLWLESRILRYSEIPMGVGLIAVARKPVG